MCGFGKDLKLSELVEMGMRGEGKMRIEND